MYNSLFGVWRADGEGRVNVRVVSLMAVDWYSQNTWPELGNHVHVYTCTNRYMYIYIQIDEYNIHILNVHVRTCVKIVDTTPCSLLLVVHMKSLRERGGRGREVKEQDTTLFAVQRESPQFPCTSERQYSQLRTPLPRKRVTQNTPVFSCEP